MKICKVSSALALAVLCVCTLHLGQAAGNNEPVASAEYYDDEFEEDDNRPLSSQKDEVRSQQTHDKQRDEGNFEDGDPLMARPKEDPLQKLLPFITFDCVGRLEGYYADLQFGCEVFHYCKKEGKRFSFICPPNSTFNQRLMICDYDKVARETCLEAPRYFHLNKQLYGIKKNYKFPELATAESQTVTKVVPLETTTPLSVERRSDTTPETTEKPTEQPSTEKPTTPTPKRAKIRTKLARPSTVAPSTESSDHKPNPVKKPPRKRKQRPSTTPRPVTSEPIPDEPKPTFKKKLRPPRPRTTPNPQTVPRLQPAPPEHISQPAVTRPAVSDSEEVTLLATPAPQKITIPSNHKAVQEQKHEPVPLRPHPHVPSSNTQTPPPLINDPPEHRPEIRPPSTRTKVPPSSVPNTFLSRPANPNFIPVPQLEGKPDSQIAHNAPITPQLQRIRPSVHSTESQRKPPKRNRKKNRPPPEPVKNEVPEYDRMFSAEQPRGAFPPQQTQPVQPNIIPQPPPQTSPVTVQYVQQQQTQPNQQVIAAHQHTQLQQPQHVTQYQTQQPPQQQQQQYEAIAPSQFQQQPTTQGKSAVHFPAEQPQYASVKPTAFGGFDPGRHDEVHGNLDGHFFRGPQPVAHFATGFDPAPAPPQPSKSISQFPGYVQEPAQRHTRPTPASRQPFEFVYQHSQQHGAFSSAEQPANAYATAQQSSGFKGQFTQSQFGPPATYKSAFGQVQPQFGQGTPSIFQSHQGYAPISSYGSGYEGLFGAASGQAPQAFYSSQAPSGASFSSSSLFPEQHVHHIHSRRRRSLDDIDATNGRIDETNVPRSRQRRQSMFSMLPNIFSRKPSRSSSHFTSASSINPSFVEVPSFYGNPFTQQLTSESQFPNFGNGFTRFFSASPQHPYRGSGGNHLRVPQMSMGSAGMFTRGRGPSTINVGGPSTFTAVSLNQVPSTSDLAMNNNRFFSQATLHKQNPPKMPSNKAPTRILGTGSGEEILSSPGTLSQTGLKPNNPALTAPKPPSGIPQQILQQSAEVVEEDDKTAISYIPIPGGKITVTLDSIEESGSSKSPSPLSFPPKQLRPTNPEEVLTQMKKSFRPHADPAIGDLTHPNDYITQVTPPGFKKEPSVSNAVSDKIKSIPYPTHLARNPEKFQSVSNMLPKQHRNSFSTPQFLVPQTQFSPQLDYPVRNPSTRGSYHHHKHPAKSVDSLISFNNLPNPVSPTQRPIPAVRQPPPMPAHLDPNNNNNINNNNNGNNNSNNNNNNNTENKPSKKRTKTRKRRPKPSTSTPLPPSMIEVVTHADSGLNVHLKPNKDSGEFTTLPTITTTHSDKRVWYGTTPQPVRYETQFPIKFNYITRAPAGYVPTTTTRAPTTLFSSSPSANSKRVYHNLVTPGPYEHRLPQRLDVTNAPLYKKNMFPPRVMATNVPHEMTAYAKYTTTPVPPSPPVMRTVNLSTTTHSSTSSSPTTTSSNQPVYTSPTTTTTTSSPFTFPTTTMTPSTTTTERPYAVYRPPSTTTTEAPGTTTSTPTTPRPTTTTTTIRPTTEPPTTPDEIFDFFTFPTTSGTNEKEFTTSPAPVFLPQSAISLDHDRHDEIIVIDTEKERENMTASASTSSISTLKPVLKVFSNRAGGTSWYKFKAMMTSTTPRPPLKMLNAVPVHDGYEKGFPFEFFTDLSLLSKTTGRPNVGATDFPQPVYKPRSEDHDQNGIQRKAK